jgi:hypothetical protein
MYSSSFYEEVILPKKTCKIEGCDRSVRARGICIKCYLKWWRKEHPEKDREYSKEYRKKHPKKKIAQRKRNYERGANFKENHYIPYDDFEYQMILDKTIVDSRGRVLRKGVTDRELAKHLGRTVQAIQGKRCLLKKEASS